VKLSDNFGGLFQTHTQQSDVAQFHDFPLVAGVEDAGRFSDGVGTGCPTGAGGVSDFGLIAFAGSTGDSGFFSSGFFPCISVMVLSGSTGRSALFVME
jgi:hypothetical protein